MQLGKVIGHATATVKHPSLTGFRLLIVQTLNSQKQPEGEAILAVDALGGGAGQNVLLDCDGKGVRELVGDDKSPARWYVVGVVDE
jgi:ethanolamine utilization protein EutN